MNKQKVFLILLIPIIVLTSCKSIQNVRKNEHKTAGGNGMVSVDWPGTYHGILPCADCDGIKTQIILDNDFSYTLTRQYVGKDDRIVQTNGFFKWEKTGKVIKLDNSEKQILELGENKLFYVDRNANRFSDYLDDRYILEKEKIEIAGTYWKLIEINGLHVKVESREPYIKFNKDENLVNGNSSCNSFYGKYDLLNGNKIKFSPFAMTKMACAGSNTEEEFMKAIEKTTSYSITLNELVFYDEFENRLAKFEAGFLK